MPNRFQQFVTRLGLSTQRLNSPAMQEESRQQDMDPNNIGQINQELTRPGNNQLQNDTLLNEKQRLEKMQLQQVQQASQQFAPRLQQSLDIQTHTGMPVEGPADKLIKLLLMMKRQQPAPGIPGVDGAPVQNPNPAGGPYNPMIGGARG